MVLWRSILPSMSSSLAVETVFLFTFVIEADDIGDCILYVVIVEVDVLVV